MGEELANAFWPGPLTLIVPRSARASDAVTGGQGTVGLRVPNHPLALAVLEAFDGGIAAPSANKFGRVSPTTAQHVRDELGAELDVILDGGPCAVGVESTIVDVSGARPRLLRPGGISLEAISAALGVEVLRAEHATDVRAPGMLASHYAPRAGVRLVAPAELVAPLPARLVVIARASVDVPPHVTWLTVPEDDAGFAQVLYAKLREADGLGEEIWVVPPDDSGLGRAVADRLRRAAAPRPRLG
jgi:L-threonylcarbamoyladenylate synthase